MMKKTMDMLDIWGLEPKSNKGKHLRLQAERWESIWNFILANIGDILGESARATPPAKVYADRETNAKIREFLEKATGDHETVGRW